MNNTTQRPSRLRMWGILLWEQWRLTRIALLGALSIMLAYVAQVVWLDSPVDRFIFVVQDDGIGTPVFVWAPAVMALLFLHVYPGLKDLRLSFPRRYFTLPIATHQVMLVHLAYRLSAACVLAIPGAYMSWRRPDPFLVDLGPIAVFFALSTVVLGGQALGVLATAYGVWGAGLTGLAMVVFLFTEAVLLIGDPGTEGRSLVYLYVLSATYAVLCMVIPWVVLKRIRYGETLALPGAGAIERTADQAAAAPQRPFASKFAAQVWFEWKHSVRYFAWIGMSIGVISLILMDWADGIPLVLGFWITLGVALATGYPLIRTPPAYLGFVAVKPMTNAQLGLAKLVAAFLGCGLVLTLAALAAFGTTANASPPHHLFYRMSRGPSFSFMVTAGYWVSALWLTFVAGRVSLALLAVAGGLIMPLFWWMEVTSHEPMLNALGAVLGICLVACILGVLAAWGLHGRVPWRRAAAVFVGLSAISCVILLGAVALNLGHVIPTVPRMIRNSYVFALHYRALPLLVIAIALLAIGAIAVKRLTWKRSLAAVAIAYAVAMAHSRAFVSWYFQKALIHLIDLEAWLVCPLLVLVFVYYVASKRRLVPPLWGLIAVSAWAAGASVYMALLQFGDHGRVSGEDLALTLVMALCAASPLWPPLALRLQRHR